MTGAKDNDWADGYIVDVEYVHNFLPGLAPLNLAFAAAIAGVFPPDVDAPFAYLDLGCGNGFTPALLAAANPHAEVWGNDFNPAHIRNARATATAAGIGNVRFVEASFADLLDEALPQFDFIAVHGIWSWVSAENRARIVDLLGRYLKPGGLAVISYNCHPGWDALLPLRQVIIDAAGREGAPGERIARALRAARALSDAGAGYFTGNPAAGRALDRLEREDSAYLAHEYLNDNWSLFQPGEVAAAVAPAGLAYAGQARIADDVDRFLLTASQRALVEAAADGAAAEALRDLIVDRRFRRDLFVRSGTTEVEDAAAWFANRRFVLTRPRADCTIPAELPGVQFTATSHLLGPLLDGLAEGPTMPAALAGASGLADAGPQDIQRALAALAALGHIQPALAEAGEPARRLATDRFNATTLAGTRMGEPAAALASPVIGSGVTLTMGEQLLLDAFRFGVPLDAIATGDEDTNAVDRFRRHRLPALAMLGIV